MGLFYTNQPFIFGESTYQNGGFFGPVPSEALNLMVVVEGSMTVSVDGGEVAVSEGQASLFYSRTAITFLFPEGRTTRVQWCETGEPAGSAWVRQQLTKAPQLVSVTPVIRQLMQLGISLVRDPGEGECALRDAIGEATICAYLNAANLDRSDAIIPEPVERARRFIEGHFNKAMSSREIARKAGISQQNLTRLFRRTFGFSPTEYLWNLRSERGAFLLRQTTMTIGEVAYECGYKNPFHFSRHMRQKFGYSPSELRRRRRPHLPSLQRVQVPDVHFGATGA